MVEGEHRARSNVLQQPGRAAGGDGETADRAGRVAGQSYRQRRLRQRRDGVVSHQTGPSGSGPRDRGRDCRGWGRCGVLQNRRPGLCLSPRPLQHVPLLPARPPHRLRDAAHHQLRSRRLCRISARAPHQRGPGRVPATRRGIVRGRGVHRAVGLRRARAEAGALAAGPDCPRPRQRHFRAAPRGPGPRLGCRANRGHGRQRISPGCSAPLWGRRGDPRRRGRAGPPAPGQRGPAG